MQKIYSETGLMDAILELETRRADEGKKLREQFNLAYESIKPINLIKSTFKEAAASQDLKNNIINTSVGLTAGYLFKISFEGVSTSPLRKLFGSVLLFGITNVVTKNPEAVKSMGKGLLRIIRNKLDVKMNGAANHETEEAVS